MAKPGRQGGIAAETAGGLPIPAFLSVLKGQKYPLDSAEDLRKAGGARCRCGRRDRPGSDPPISTIGGSSEPAEPGDGPRLWGHERVGLPPADREVARQMRMRAAAAGLRAPAQVMDGHYKLLSETCPCWDGVNTRAD